MKAAEVLDVRWLSSDLDEELSVRDYLKRLLLELFRDDESFSGKRPFGNSGWQYDIAFPLIACGFLKGTIDEGAVEDFDGDDFDEAIKLVIEAL